MIEPKAIASAIQQKSPSGHPAFTQSQIADLAINEDSFLGKKIRKAMDLGVTKEQAIRYYGIGSSGGPVETEKPKQSFFSRFTQGVSDYATAPGEAMAGGIMKGISKIPGMGFAANDQSVKNLPQNLTRSADLARVAIPVAAGIATGGASIPLSAAVSGAAGAGSSLLASGLEAVAGEGQTAGGAIGEALTTGVLNAGLDAATMGLFRLASPILKPNILDDAAKLATQEEQALKTTGKVVQGTAEDINAGRKALQSIDTAGVKTYADLDKTIATKLNALKTNQDTLLDAIPGTHKIDQLATTVKVGEKTGTDNFVKSAIDGLEELYGKIGNTEGVLKIQALREAGEAKGLAVRQINDLAREYGRGFKAFSDSTGQPLTSINAKLYETIRKGLKNVSRNLMPNEASKAIDEEMFNLITTKGLIEDMADKVQLLSNKVNMRPLGDRIGSFMGKIVNAASFGTAGGFLKGITPSNEGLKQLNSLQIQKHLPKNLEKLSTLIKQIDSLPEETILSRLKDIFGNVIEEGTKAATKIGVGAATNAAND